ncbi:hypothetical protein EST38_g5305 [Candolleomyces aberdarensis]|uniref:DUF6533 domain-containing protein n=1 Tax=Candolleomyces aberdarensis TaxID=2316362 RepID=A0A4Q2DNZ6_9AGAR|nr:hypothetical protein EST38_g5305 [Candolleomyces aberdarensis]
MSFDPRVVRRAQFTRADFDIQIASLALLYYDYLLTLPDEIEYIWKKPKKLSTVFYVCCRYYLVANLLWTLTKMNVGLRYYSLIHSIGIAVGVLVILFEILAFVMAAIRAWSSIREDARFWEHPTRSLNYIIFSQGLLYLSAVLVITIVTAVCNLQVWGGFARPLNSLKLPYVASCFQEQ